MTDDTNKRGRLSDITQTYVPLTQLGAILVGVVGAAMWAQEGRHRDQLADQRMERIELEIRGLARSFEDAAQSRWRFIDMQMWTQIMSARNPELDVPEPVPGG